MATAELAIALFGTVVVLGVLLCAIGVAVAEVKVNDAARAAARAAARGDSRSQISAAAHRSAPSAQLSVALTDRRATIDVTMRVNPPLPGLRGLGVSVKARSVADREQR